MLASVAPGSTAQLACDQGLALWHLQEQDCRGESGKDHKRASVVGAGLHQGSKEEGVRGHQGGCCSHWREYPSERFCHVLHPRRVSIIGQWSRLGVVLHLMGMHIWCQNLLALTPGFVWLADMASLHLKSCSIHKFLKLRSCVPVEWLCSSCLMPGPINSVTDICMTQATV